MKVGFLCIGASMTMCKHCSEGRCLAPNLLRKAKSRRRTQVKIYREKTVLGFAVYVMFSLIYRGIGLLCVGLITFEIFGVKPSEAQPYIISLYTACVLIGVIEVFCDLKGHRFLVHDTMAYRKRINAYLAERGWIKVKDNAKYTHMSFRGTRIIVSDDFQASYQGDRVVVRLRIELPWPLSRIRSRRILKGIGELTKGN